MISSTKPKPQIISVATMLCHGVTSSLMLRARDQEHKTEEKQENVD